MTTLDPGKTGTKTTEFWLTLLTAVSPLLGIVFHHDVSSYFPAVASLAAAVSVMVYAFTRSTLKQTIAMVNPAQPVVVDPTPSEVSASPGPLPAVDEPSPEAPPLTVVQADPHS